MNSNLISNLFPFVSESQIKTVEEFINCYNSWNSKINLVSRKDIDNLLIKHVIHSLLISKIINFSHDSSIIDIGTGGGFPGIPLAIAFPNSHFTLVDSTKKKIDAVIQISHHLNLHNISCINSRIENITQQYDYITGRAVANPTNFISLVFKNLKQNSNAHNSGIIYLTGPNDLSVGKNIISKQHLFVHKTLCSNLFNNDYFLKKEILHIHFLNKY